MVINSMIIDELDVFLIRTIAEYALKEKEITTWDLAKKYDWGKNWEKLSVLKRKQFLDGQSTRITYRLKRMSEEGIVSIKKDNHKNHFVLDGNRIRCIKHTFPNGRKNAVLIKDSENKWSAFEI